ncbi:MAG TPA: cupin domain-containing protein [Candidatus Limnocylindria bacterium]|nr:cupin domain-containing protein [Candidatus Limnocylindria bacterium]
MADAFRLDDLVARLDTTRHDFAEFFRAPSGTLSMTVAYWPAGSVDDQDPHAEDEVYFVAAGRARLRVADDDRAVGPGSLVYVAAGVDHRFHDVDEDLRVLVFWSPPRHSAVRPPTADVASPAGPGRRRVRWAGARLRRRGGRNPRG